MKNKLIILMFALFACINIYAYEWSINEEDSILTISGTGDMNRTSAYSGGPWYSQRGKIKTVIIENGITSIGEGAFKNCINLTSVSIPNSINRIEERAFEGCYRLLSIIVPEGVTTIDEETFSGCSGLMSIVIPNSVTNIKFAAFMGCTSLIIVNIPNSVTSIDSYAFTNVFNVIYSGSANGAPWGAKHFNSYTEAPFVYEDSTKTNLIRCSKDAAGNIIIPSCVEAIDTKAFYGCKYINSISIPNNVRVLQSQAFANCPSLASIQMNDSVEILGDSLFYDCSNLTSITIPENVDSVGIDVFLNCTNLTSVTWNAINCSPRGYFYSIFPTSVDSFVIGDGVQLIPDKLCYGLNNLSSIIIPSSVTSIGAYAFCSCSSMTSVDIPSSVISIGASAFSGCSSISSIIIPNSVTSIGQYAFSGCTGLTTISIPSSVRTLASATFRNCSNLSTVFWNIVNGSDYRNNVSPFYGSSNITSFTFGEGVKHIPVNVCKDLPNVNIVTIPSSVQSIGEDAFYGCTNLTKVIINSNTIVGKQYSTSSNISQFFGTQVAQYIIGDSITKIGKYAFSGCSSLISVSLSNSVIEIGRYAFNSCTNLATINFPESIIDCGDFAFVGCYSLTSPIYNSHVFAHMPSSYSGSYDIPSGVEQLAGGAFYNCTGLTSITIPNSVTRVGSIPFYGCTDLSSPVYNSRVFAHMPKTFSGSYSILDGIESVAGGAFLQCTNLTSITIPSSVSSLGASSFYYCSSLDNVICNGQTPPQIVDDNLYGESYVGLFYPAPLNLGIYVPCNTLNDYKTAEYWKKYKDKIKNAPSSVQGVPLVVGTGYVSYPRTICENSIEAIPSYGYHFVKWNDGNVDNPRIIDPEIAATYTAEFAVDKSGKCGDDLLLTWVYDSDSKKLTISGNGTLDSNKQFGIEAPSEMEVLEIADGVQTIGESTFSGVSTLKTAHIGKDVRKINNYAFNNCINLTSIYNYRPTPCAAYDNTFNEVDKFACIIYVPVGSEDMYRAATGWKDFYTIQGFESGVNNVLADDSVLELLSNPATRIFTVQGNEVSVGRENLPAGVYVLCLDNRVVKVMIH